MTLLNSKDGTNFYIPEKKSFRPKRVDPAHVKQAFTFAYGMTFGREGAHRTHRSGGSYRRRNGEIFCDAFQGKLAEYFVYQSFTEMGIICPEPDTEKWNRGKWDDADFIINEKSINVKSMAFFSNLLLLETKDWDEIGTYIPNNKAYDYFLVARIQPEAKALFRKRRMLYSDDISSDQITQLLNEQTFSADIPGFVTNTFLRKIIQEKQILPKGAMLNGHTKMDAENFYVISCDFVEVVEIMSPLTKEL
tara:strand:+ start:372 stop:1118 length:747 start_codon:yes stop_codon:yes gene_type:complete